MNHSMLFADWRVRGRPAANYVLARAPSATIRARTLERLDDRITLTRFFAGPAHGTHEDRTTNAQRRVSMSDETEAYKDARARAIALLTEEKYEHLETVRDLLAAAGGDSRVDAVRRTIKDWRSVPSTALMRRPEF